MKTNGKVAVRILPGKGRGLVAKIAIAAGKVIDAAPAVVLSGEDCDRLEATVLGNYYFAHPDSAQHGMFVLGLPSVANHSDEPNTTIAWRHEDGTGWTAELTALRDIAAGEELCFRYRCPPWFPVVR